MNLISADYSLFKNSQSRPSQSDSAINYRKFLNTAGMGQVMAV